MWVGEAIFDGLMPWVVGCLGWLDIFDDRLGGLDVLKAIFGCWIPWLIWCFGWLDVMVPLSWCQFIKMIEFLQIVTYNSRRTQVYVEMLLHLQTINLPQLVLCFSCIFWPDLLSLCSSYFPQTILWISHVNFQLYISPLLPLSPCDILELV